MFWVTPVLVYFADVLDGFQLFNWLLGQTDVMMRALGGLVLIGFIGLLKTFDMLLHFCVLESFIVLWVEVGGFRDFSHLHFIGKFLFVESRVHSLVEKLFLNVGLLQNIGVFWWPTVGWLLALKNIQKFSSLVFAL